MQAYWRAITAKLFRSVITFKATAKGGGALENSAFRDLWLPSLSFFVLMVSVVCHPAYAVCLVVLSPTLLFPGNAHNTRTLLFSTAYKLLHPLVFQFLFYTEGVMTVYLHNVRFAMFMTCVSSQDSHGML